MVKIFLTWCPSTALMGALAQSCCSDSLQRGRSSSCKPSPRNARVIWTQTQTHWVSLVPSCSTKRQLGHTGGFQGSVQGVTICSQSVMETHLRYHHSFKIKYFFYCGYSQPLRDNAHIPDASSTLSMKTRVLFTFPLQACSPVTRNTAGSTRRQPTSLHRAHWVICATQTAELLLKCPAQPPVRGSTHALSTEPRASSVGGAAQLQGFLSQWTGR